MKKINGGIAKTGNENVKEHFTRNWLFHEYTHFLYQFETWRGWLNICLIVTAGCWVIQYKSPMLFSGSCCSWLRCNDWMHRSCSREFHCHLGNKVMIPSMVTSTFEPTDYNIKKACLDYYCYYYKQFKQFDLIFSISLHIQATGLTYMHLGTSWQC